MLESGERSSIVKYGYTMIEFVFRQGQVWGGVIGGSNPEIPARKSKNPEISEENFENIGSRKKILKNTKI